MGETGMDGEIMSERKGRSGTILDFRLRILDLKKDVILTC